MADTYQIPTELHIGFLNTTISTHWEYHAAFMASVWLILVPAAIVSLRYYKPKPTFKGLTKRIKPFEPTWGFFNFHKYGLYAAIGLSTFGFAIAILVSRGFSGTVHSIFGITTVILGILQGVSAYNRGGHGGRHYEKNDPNNPDTWRGDHYDMTPRRKKFEAYHKTVGYFTMFCVVGTISSGLVQYPISWLAWAVAALLLTFSVWAVIKEYQGTVYDTYRAAFGTDPEAPYNKLRKDK